MFEHFGRSTAVTAVGSVGLALLLTTTNLWGQAWSSNLQDGGTIRVNPETHRATVVGADGSEHQLWDGVHRLQDGSIVTIRQGTATPTKKMSDYWAAQRLAARPFVEGELSPCGRLARKACGLHDECAADPACDLARQTLKLHEDEIKEGGYAQTATQCQEALDDDQVFPSCAKPQRGSRLSACEQLFDKVCGSENQCKGHPACAPVRKLVEAEFDERRSSLDPDRPTASSQQCRQALGDGNAGFFQPCGK